MQMSLALPSMLLHFSRAALYSCSMRSSAAFFALRSDFAGGLGGLRLAALARRECEAQRDSW